jgi:hypothetical protein
MVHREYNILIATGKHTYNILRIEWNFLFQKSILIGETSPNCSPIKELKLLCVQIIIIICIMSLPALLAVFSLLSF